MQVGAVVLPCCESIPLCPTSLPAIETVVGLTSHTACMHACSMCSFLDGCTLSAKSAVKKLRCTSHVGLLLFLLHSLLLRFLIPTMLAHHHTRQLVLCEVLC